ncbi:related to beta-tubulin binding protein [Cephalotrichum gorgonifer]|uniref:Tubulin-specific chaperone A n=1 Tax=Cephalotrichum gorgonifer TaxID=2041049 RepID=A0AAE8MPF4_9PEZI|nr:related to beta-tubulin binding protein [Cephalotrichum gorgonifer]
MATNGSKKLSKLQISTQALLRLVKEEKSYHKELEQDKAAVAALRAELARKLANGETPGENDEYMIGQRDRAIKETEAVFAPLHTKIDNAVSNLEDAVKDAQDATEEELGNAKKAIADAKVLLAESAAAE